MKRIAITLLTMLAAVISAYSQSRISGRVLLAGTGEPVEFANIIVRDPARRAVLTYTTTDGDGRYVIEGLFGTDSLEITVTAVNIEKSTALTANVSRTLDFTVREKKLELNEAVITATAPAVRRGGDTLTYFAARYRDDNDLVAEDIIRKLPGIEVAESGRIAYQGKEISRFYIEGMDMLGKGYTLASKNISADDIQSIEIYENHQHIRALQEMSRPDEAAMNIILKEGARGTWTGSLLAGAGYSPWMWRGEVSAMYFGKRMQSINTYKTNNMGYNAAMEFGSPESAASIIGVRLPTEPPLDEDLFMDNNIHAASSNFLFRLSGTAQLTLNADYTHDIRKSEGVSTTVHNIVGGMPITVNEVTSASRRSDRANLTIGIENNKRKSYINDILRLSGEFNRDMGSVISDGTPVSQAFRLPSLSATNSLHMIIPVAGRMSLNLLSNTSYNYQPTSLRVTPVLFPDIFGAAQADEAVQMLSSSQLITRNSLSGVWTRGGWTFSIGMGLNAHIEDMASQLYTTGTQAADSMRNDIGWQRYDLTLGPGVSYKAGDRLFISAHVNADLMTLRTRDRVRGRKDGVTRVIASPVLRLNGEITQDLKYSASASYTEAYGGLYDSYGGFIMTDYRNIATKDGELRHTRSQNYLASLSYSSALNLIFANLEASYYRAGSNLTYAYSYDGALTRIESVAAPNLSHGLGLEAKVSKHFLPISTLISAGGGWRRSWSGIIRQGVRLDSRSDIFTASLGLNTRFTRWLTLDYSAAYSRSETAVESLGYTDPIDNIKQEGELLFSFGRGVTLSVDCEHYYNGSLQPRHRNMVFLGAELSVKTRHLTYALKGRNLLNTASYSSAYTSDITDYVYSYALRPPALIATVRYNF